VTVLGYGPEARAHALRLREAGHAVTIGMRPGGMSWLRASEDGFAPQPTGAAVQGAEVVMVMVPEEDQASVFANAVSANLAKGALLVFARGHALYTGAVEPKEHDVVLMTAACKVAVHGDATGRALERATSFARAALAAGAKVGTTSVAEEVEADLAAFEERVGGPEAFVAELDRVLQESTHEPDCAKLGFYERLRAIVSQRAKRSGARPARPASVAASSTPDVTFTGVRLPRMRGVA
jgi:ketol-acid reductoisomerase